MTYEVTDVSDWLIRHAQKRGAEMPVAVLLDLAYYSHGWHLEATGRPLFCSRVEAWGTGPVAPDIYDIYSGDCFNIARPVGEVEKIGNPTQQIMEQVYSLYAAVPRNVMIRMKTAPDTPWGITMVRYGKFGRIYDGLTLAHFQKKRRDANAQKKEQNPKTETGHI